MDGETPGTPEKRRFFDLPRWANEEAAYLFSGGFALCGIFAFVAAGTIALVTAVGRLDRVTGTVASGVLIGLGLLFLAGYRGVERSAVFPTAGEFKPEFPREIVFAVDVVSEGNFVRKLLEGSAAGQIIVEETTFHVRIRRSHASGAGVAWLASSLLPKPWSATVGLGLIAVALFGVILDLRTRRQRYAWSEVPTVAVRGNRFVFEYAVADDRGDLVVEVLPSRRESLIGLLSKSTRVEILDAA
jgi:hypothetical protein